MLAPTGNQYQLGLLKSISGFGDSTSDRNIPFNFACPAKQLLQGFAAQQCAVSSAYPNRALCNLQFQCTVSAVPSSRPPSSTSPKPPGPAPLQADHAAQRQPPSIKRGTLMPKPPSRPRPAPIKQRPSLSKPILTPSNPKTPNKPRQTPSKPRQSTLKPRQPHPKPRQTPTKPR